MQTRQLIINADGYGLTAGTNRAIEECVRFGTVKSVSVNVNFPDAEEISRLVREHPGLSVGCRLNPVVGRPVLPEEKVRSLLNRDGEFWYRAFDWKLYLGHIDLWELRLELFAQVKRCRELAGDCFTHIDCHMAKHRLPRFYPLFLEACRYGRVRRVRTHRYFIASAANGVLAGGLRYYLAPSSPVRRSGLESLASQEGAEGRAFHARLERGCVWRRKRLHFSACLGKPSRSCAARRERVRPYTRATGTRSCRAFPDTWGKGTWREKS